MTQGTYNLNRARAIAASDIADYRRSIRLALPNVATKHAIALRSIAAYRSAKAAQVSR